GQDDERHAGRQNRDEGVLTKHVHQVGLREERVRGQPDDQALDGERYEDRVTREEAAEGHAGVARAMMRSGVASARDSSPTVRPSHITTMRSDMPITSGRSDEIMRMPSPSSVSRFIAR